MCFYFEMQAQKEQFLFLTSGTHQNYDTENMFTYENFQVSLCLKQLSSLMVQPGKMRCQFLLVHHQLPEINILKLMTFAAIPMFPIFCRPTACLNIMNSFIHYEPRIQLMQIPSNQRYIYLNWFPSFNKIMILIITYFLLYIMVTHN